MTIGLNNNGNDALLENVNAVQGRGNHESPMTPLLKMCVAKTLSDGLDESKISARESLNASDDMRFIAEVGKILHKCYNDKTEKLVLSPEAIEFLQGIRSSPQNASKISILDAAGLKPDKVDYTKEQLRTIREDLKQENEACSKRFELSTTTSTQIYNKNMMLVQMLKSIVKGHDNAAGAHSRKFS